MPCFALCTECNRHVRREEAACPFCGGNLVAAPCVSNAAGSSRAVLVAAVTAAAGAVGACSAPMYGAHCEDYGTCESNGVGAYSTIDAAVPSTGGYNAGGSGGTLTAGSGGTITNTSGTGGAPVSDASADVSDFTDAASDGSDANDVAMSDANGDGTASDGTRD